MWMVNVDGVSRGAGCEPAAVIGGLGSLYEALGALHWPLIRATA
jgi:hypothetical protein